MKNEHTCILTTTINIPYFLNDILRNVKKFKHKNTYVVVIADKKTPLKAKTYCKSISMIIRSGSKLSTTFNASFSPAASLASRSLNRFKSALFSTLR